MKKILLLILFLSVNCFAQFSKTHYIPPLGGADGQPAQSQFIYISSPSLTPINFTIYNLGGGTINGTVSRNSPYVFNVGFGTNTQLMVSNANVNTVQNNKGFIIEAEDQVYAAVRLTATPQNFQAGGLVSKGLAALGTQFRIGAFVNTGISAINTNHYTFISVLATENNTTVSFSDIKPGVSLINNAGAGNTPPNVTLNRGQSFVLATTGPTDGNRDGLIGALVSSDKPITVNCGSFGGTNGTNDNNIDLGFDQIVSAERVGNEYIFVRGFGENVTERALIVAHENNTQVFLNGNTGAPNYTLNAGQYVAIDGSLYSTDGNLYVNTSKNVFAYQGVGGSTQANQEMYFVPPLSCQTPKIIDNIPLLHLIGNSVYTTNSGLNIVTETGATLDFILNGTNYSLAGLPGTVNAQGPFTIPGNANYVTYKLTGITGNISVFADKQLYISYFGSNDNATYGGYYSGFTFKPEISFNRLDLTSSNCIPNVNLSINSLSPFDTYQWYFNGDPIVGANSPNYTPTVPGFYYLSATVTTCNITLISDEIPVSDCAIDTDNDNVFDNIDIDLDNDGITNCTESFGDVPIDLSNAANGNFSVATYSNGYNGLISIIGSGTPPPTPFIGSTDGTFITNPADGIGKSVQYEMQFNQPVSIKLEYVDTANTVDLLSSSGEFIIQGDIDKTITLLNPTDQLLVDTNYDGIYENGVTEFSSFQIRFRLNSATSLAAGTGTFSFSTHLTNFISIRHINLTDNTSKASFKLKATCVPKDTDGDGIPDQKDLDSDNDGIPDNSEAQGQNFIAYTTVDVNKDGLSDAYGNGLIPIDTDGDSVPDYLDLDSDNDGIYDWREAGLSATDSNNDGRIDGVLFGNNGLADNLETTPENGILNYTITDTNNDGIANYISLDSDGDLCFDVIEAGFSDTNNDGFLGNTAPVTNANGVVTNSAIGYTVPNLNYIIAAPISISTQPTNQVTCNTQNASFQFTATPSDNYQWQVSTNNGTTWNNLTNSAIYSGVTTINLQITGATTSMNNYQYRVFINRNGNSCGLYSDASILTVYPLPVLNSPVTIVQCDDDDTNDGISFVSLIQKNSELSANSQNETFTYFTSAIAAQNNNPAFQITNPVAYFTGNTTIWVRVENADGCFEVGQINVFVSATQIPSTFIRRFSKCDQYFNDIENDRDGVSQFDFSSVTTDILALLPTTNTYTIAYYRTQADALAETDANGNSLAVNPAAYQNIGFPGFQQIWVRVESAVDNACYGIGPFVELTVEDLPTAHPIADFITCDDDYDGLFPFDTSTIETTVLNGQSPSNIIVSFFDQNNNPLPSPLPNPYLSGSKTITIRVTNTTTNDPNGPCFDETTLTFKVDVLPRAFAVADFVTCDIDGIEDGKFQFDTSSLGSTLLNGQTGMVVTYFDQNGASLPSPFPSNFFTTSQTIKAVVTNPLNTTCFAERDIVFTVNPLPQLEENEKIIVCENTDPITIIAGLLVGNTSDFSYKWFKDEIEIVGENNSTLTVQQNGIYRVIVTNIFGCTQTRTIEIVYSQPATIDDIVIVDLSNNNTVTIFVSGSGNYVYSLDSENGLFQTSNQFFNVIAGLYTVYVKDLLGCETVSQEIAVLGVPKFFTPNGDGFNDSWNIRGANERSNGKSIIYIFDRYGKLIKQISPLGNGWDGTYNGRPLPSDDYWYSIQFEDGRSAKGHFSLKR
ncbi:T9SS type B sorting domain-containing protein [Flavobacterium filum]|uniref:T9SS type B sorting domain-containing protein n=1 Tax=Flavobacterium filum TaxID=370974 RepID=UPI0023F313A8|nr:T9SS type B sorting domain-containing protein [Flavobacterium filum]